MEFGPSYTSKRHKNGWSTTCLLVKGMWAKFNRFATICIENCITSATLGNASMKTISKTLNTNRCRAVIRCKPEQGLHWIRQVATGLCHIRPSGLLNADCALVDLTRVSHNISKRYNANDGVQKSIKMRQRMTDVSSAATGPFQRAPTVRRITGLCTHVVCDGARVVKPCALRKSQSIVSFALDEKPSS